jgi:hypothetical protein
MACLEVDDDDDDDDDDVKYKKTRNQLRNSENVTLKNRIQNSPLQTKKMKKSWDDHVDAGKRPSDAYVGVSKSFRTESITKYTLITTHTRWEATQRAMYAKFTRVTHKTAIQLRLVAESCTIYSSRSRRPVRKLLDTPSRACLRDDIG